MERSSVCFNDANHLLFRSNELLHAVDLPWRVRLWLFSSMYKRRAEIISSLQYNPEKNVIERARRFNVSSEEKKASLAYYQSIKAIIVRRPIRYHGLVSVCLFCFLTFPWDHIDSTFCH